MFKDPADLLFWVFIVFCLVFMLYRFRQKFRDLLASQKRGESLWDDLPSEIKVKRLNGSCVILQKETLDDGRIGYIYDPTIIADCERKTEESPAGAEPIAV